MNPNESIIKTLLSSVQKIKTQLAIIEINEQFKINVPKTNQEIIDRIIEKMVLQDSFQLLRRDIENLQA